MKTLKNNYCSVTYKEDKKEISGQDFTDQNNLPAFYNNSVRGIKTAWEALELSFTDRTTMNEAVIILSDNKIKIHTYCMMD